MKPEQIHKIVSAQRSYFSSGATLPVGIRLDALRRLKAAIVRHEADIARALYQDLGKSSEESYLCEIGMVLDELTFMLRHTGTYAKEHRVRTPLAQFAAHSYTKASPLGVVLIMSPWNYPFLLTLDPLIDAIAAGNTAIVKPSAYSPCTSAVIQTILSACFAPQYVAVVTGGREENRHLLDETFDHIFFTGSQAVGREVLRRAAEHLTPCTLELGGKSPVIVDRTANIARAARRIVFGKFLNCGQTCVAPDYIYCDARVRDALVKALMREIRRQFGADALCNPKYGKIINQKHFDRISRLIDRNKLVYGGKFQPEQHRISPTILTDVTWDDPVMQEEIFGPILPILTYDSLDEALIAINSHPHPLALYLFSEDKKTMRRITQTCSFGGGCINDTIIHLATPHMGFGGVGASGMGAYHGKTGFETFSHRKSIVDKKTWLDLPMRYQPYRKSYSRLVRLFLH